MTEDTAVQVTFTLHRGTPPPLDPGERNGHSYIIFELSGYGIQGYTRIQGGYIMDDVDATLVRDDELMNCVGYVEQGALSESVRLALGLEGEE